MVRHGTRSTMKRTRKWAFVRQEAERLMGLGLPLREIARRIEVNESTIHRWIKAGKLVRQSGVAGTSQVSARQTPMEWAETVRATYSLDASDDQLVTLATRALEMALDLTESAMTRLSAMGRFQAAVKQLALVARLADQDAPAPTTPTRPVRPSPTADPRVFLKAG